MTREAKFVGGALGAVAIAILAAVTASTWAVAAGASPELRILFRVMCHGLESRCLVLWDTPMPICARCFAIYAGLLVGVAAFAFFGFLRARPLPLSGLFALSVPLMIDGFSQAFGLRESVNELRIFTGVLAGSGFALWCLGVIESNARERLHISRFESLTRERIAP